MSKLLLTRGLPGSGKSTWARAWVAEDPDHRLRVNRDDTRIFLGTKHGDDEPFVTKIQQAAVRAGLKDGKDVVVDDTNLNAKFAKEWLKIAAELGAEVEWHDEFLDVPFITCLARDRARKDGQVGEEVIRSFFTRYLSGGRHPKRPQLNAEEVPVHKPYSGTPGKPKAVLVDLDGTIASNGPDRDHPNRGYFDWHRVGEDLPIQPIINLVWWLQDTGLTAVFVSGRDAICRPETMQWLGKYVEDTRKVILHMRPEGDNRKDSIVKLEIFDEHIRDNYDVKFCIDDRQQVVDAYRSIGLTVLQCAPGNF